MVVDIDLSYIENIVHNIVTVEHHIVSNLIELAVIVIDNNCFGYQERLD